MREPDPCVSEAESVLHHACKKLMSVKCMAQLDAHRGGEWRGQEGAAGKALVFLFDLTVCLTGKILVWLYLLKNCFQRCDN